MEKRRKQHQHAIFIFQAERKYRRGLIPTRSYRLTDKRTQQTKMVISIRCGLKRARGAKNELLLAHNLCTEYVMDRS